MFLTLESIFMPSPCLLNCIFLYPRCGPYHVGRVSVYSLGTSAFNIYGLDGIMQAYRPIHEDQDQNLEGKLLH